MPPDAAGQHGAPPADPAEAWRDCMRRGDWEAAWRLADGMVAAHRHGPRDWTVPRHLQAIWDGTPPGGRRVLVRCYHGLGDTIQFIRFVPRLACLVAEVTVWVQPGLIALLQGTPGLGRLLPLHDGTPEAEYEVDMEIMELPHVLRVTPATLPATAPYLHLPCPPAPRRLRPGLRVGVVWQAGDWDRRRSLPPELLRPLAAVPGVMLHLLQRGPGLAEAPPGLGVPDGADDILQAACRMAALDLILTVDSMPAHLAGALGLPVWTLLAAGCDWRWMEGRADTPWYPTMRLFRQRRPGDWQSVIAEVEQALRARLAARS